MPSSDSAPNSHGRAPITTQDPTTKHAQRPNAESDAGDEERRTRRQQGGRARDATNAPTVPASPTSLATARPHPATFQQGLVHAEGDEEEWMHEDEVTLLLVKW